ncbi:hypothetical protein [Planctellipticum variicoloris]|uniref:hypothetical protein n=1 Tax=Planctellipticum variicoloris TaxID=3064265 RepID=UPI00301353B3|nr:hypothetical protein SH412_002135 [Planctomycetaceae bacterium SH412]
MPKKCVRYQSSFKILGWPLLAVACGPDPATGETRGWARGIIAFGDIATGVIAIGGLAGGGIAVGGLACGLATVGGVALGGLVLAGVAIGGVSFGGVAVGHYAKGGVGVGTYVVSPKRQDPEALRVFGGKTREEKVDRPPMEEDAKKE